MAVFQLDGTTFPLDPIKTRWTRTKVSTRGTGEPIFSAYWNCEMEFSYLQTTEKNFFFNAFIAGGLHTAYLPHPRDDVMTLFIGVVFDQNDSEKFDIAGFADGNKIILKHILAG